jgi:hypothetical protein
VREIVNGPRLTPLIFGGTRERQIEMTAMTTILVEQHTGRSRIATKRMDDAIGVSRWRHRIPIVALAVCGFCIAVYLSAFQFHMIPRVWDPLFGNGSERVLRSFISRLLPLPDALLGALGYAVEIVLAIVGGTIRWRTNTRLVCLYGAVVLCLAITAIALTAIQIFVLHAACTLCLCSAGLSLIIAALAVPEVAAAVQNLSHRT